eukprot:6373932-Alexandrium_andersonii.AAC.1
MLTLHWHPRLPPPAPSPAEKLPARPLPARTPDPSATTMATTDHKPLHHTADEPFARRGVMTA